MYLLVAVSKSNCASGSSGLLTTLHLWDHENNLRVQPAAELQVYKSCFFPQTFAEGNAGSYSNMQTM